MDSPCPKSQPRNPNPPSMDSPCSKSQPRIPNSLSMCLPTPEKPPENIPSRTRHRTGFTQAARSGRRSEDPTLSVRSKLDFDSSSSPSKQENAAKSADREKLPAKSKLDFDSSSSPCKPENVAKSAEREKLPAKCETLGVFFDALDTAIRLSELKGSMATFSKLSARIAVLTKRRFSYGHLAQLKHILPEAIVIKSVLMFEERSSCMEPDLHITLDYNAIEFDEQSNLESKNIGLGKVLRARLVDFVKAHPQDEEIPEEPLPEPFNRKKQKNYSDGELVSSSLPDENLASSEEQERAVASHLPPPSSRNYVISPSEKTISANALSGEKLSLDPFSDEKHQSSNSKVKPESSDPAAAPLEAGSPVKEMGSTPVKLIMSPSKFASTPVASTPDKVDSTPVNVASTAPELAPTPAWQITVEMEAQAQKGSGLTRVDNDLVDPPNELVRHITPTSRSLDFNTFVEEKAMEVTNDDVSVREEGKRRYKMIACLPRLFNIIHFLFQSIGQPAITRAEIVHKIISADLHIAHRSEVEEQLDLMLELVPEWISEKRTLSGDLLVCVKFLSSPENVRSRLEEENRQVTAPVS